ncbi:HIT family protein [Candidatus Woesearchaeota archaeon]|nr:HIT family protein [Candidatus Woesearchaeota archaeon]
MQQLTEEQRKQLEEKLKGMTPEQIQALQKQQCIFCQIISGKVPSKKIYEDKKCFVILDINPAAKGHLLLLPRDHYSIVTQVPEELLGHLFVVARNLSQVLLKTFKADGTNLFVANGAAAGQRAQHFILHLIPRKSGDTLLNQEEKLVDQQMVEKVKIAVEGKLQILLGKKEMPKKEPVIVAEEKYLTSASAKRYHRQNCAFAQNIPEENKVWLSRESATSSAREPCTCVSGKRIPLSKDGKKSRVKKEKAAGTKKSEPKKSSQQKVKEQKSEKGADLDDIARLFS